ncbi:5'/3'-nucleotidase SurE [Lujinxingia vulgaris]|uniref:5'-nucleotidase SurE n=1 Tax=Lujinxingia vulgaris TaxID=2600176 RepID=A0A5C6XHZ0_9DELT|nr:5'/3'-nucleotidase SurE [Lujinxingia vulgaris]TXD38485.1 5'/3'-nucleotidase SurE [Lujinxingia vulgaris]
MTRPLILVSNDDGIDATGINILADAMSDLGEVWVVAPATEQSAVSGAISLRQPLRIDERAPGRLAVSGTPTDCVYIALNHALPRRPDLCVSGINHGANLGDDVLYSGTVAAAIEATLSDVPSIAFSQAGRGAMNAELLATWARRIAAGALKEGMPRASFLNVNFPPELSGSSGVRVSKLGRRNYGRQVVAKEDPRHLPYYWLGGSELGFDDMPGSDCNVVAEGHISLSPVDLDLTHYRFLNELRQWDALQPLTDPRLDGSPGDTDV